MNNRYEKVMLDEFGERVNAHQVKLYDIVDRMRIIEYESGGKVKINSRLLQPDTVCNDVGFIKLCEKLGCPPGWMKSTRCPSDLEKTIVDRLKQDVPGMQLFRLRMEEEETVLRSVLSDRYLVYNHSDMWADINEIMNSTGLVNLNPKIWKPSIEDNLDAWILFDTVVADPETVSPSSYDGGGFGGLKPAIHFRNSEDGTGAVRLEGGLYRSYCANGVIFGFKETERVRQVHKGNRWQMKGYVWAGLTSAMEYATKGIDLYVAATKVQLSREIDLIVKRWTSQYALSAETSGLWEKALKEACPKTNADFVMATSDFAGYQNREITTQMEEMAGAMLESKVL